MCVALAGTQFFAGQHTGETILQRLQSLRLVYGLLPKMPPEHPWTETEIRADPSGAFTLEDQGDRMSITTDRGPDMAKAADSGTFEWTPCICHILNTAVDYGLKHSGIMTFLTPLCALAKQLCKSPALWRKFSDMQREYLSTPKEHGSDSDETDEDYSGCDSSDESNRGLSDDVDADGSDDKPEVQQLTRVLRLGSWCQTRWNSTFYLIK